MMTVKRHAQPCCVALAGLLALSCQGVRAGEDLPLPANPYALDPSDACGPWCLTFLDRYFGGSTPYGEVIRICPPGPFGTSLDQVRSAAAKMGYNTLPFKRARVDQLKRLNYPSIIHLSKNEGKGHFVVLLGWDRAKTAFRVFNPPYNLGYADAGWVSEHASGLGVAISREPLPPIERLLALQPISVFDLLITGVLLAMCFSAAYGTWRRTPAGPAATRFAWQRPMTALLIVAWLPLASSGCSKRESGVASSDPYDFHLGRVLSGTVLKHTFSIKNSSNQPFSVTKVQKSCSCQVTKVELGREVPPGQSIRVSVEVPTVGREGPYGQDFSVETTSKAPGFDSIRLRVRADIDAKIKAIPSQVMLGLVEAGTAPKAEVSVIMNKPDLGDAFVSAAAVANSHLSVRLIDRTVGHLKFEVALDDNAPTGAISGKVVLTFNDKDIPELVVPVLGHIEGDLKATPRVLIVPNPGERSVKLRLASSKKHDFRITGIDAPQWLTVDSQGEHPKQSFDLVIRVGERPQSGRYHFKIRTDDRRQREVDVPVLVR